MTIDNASPEWIALSRMSFGPKPEDVARAQQIGLAAYIEEQLAAPAADDPLTQAMLASFTALISYPAGPNWPAVNENRPLTMLSKSLGELWQRGLVVLHGMLPSDENLRTVDEVKYATWIRAVHSTYQLREVMCEFWHTHFSINAGANGGSTNAPWPAYDRDVIRANALGNFRQLLEAVGTSTDMMFFLDNVSNSGLHPNENYAREMMELHTLGRANYYDHQFDQAGTLTVVPPLPTGEPAGFTDDDVFGAAKALSGWTVDQLSGGFTYLPRQHSTAPARVLGVDLAPYTAPLAAGRKVFDLAAYHPKTAEFVTGKLLLRLYGEGAPQSLKDKAVAAWLAARTAPDQIQQVLRAILNAPEFLLNPGNKYRRPFELIVGFIRATGGVAMPSRIFTGAFDETGYPMFAWPTPDGIPDTNAFWLNTNTLLRCWNICLSLYGAGFSQGAQAVLASQMPADAKTADAIIGYWSQRMLGGPLSSQSYATILNDATGPQGIGRQIGVSAAFFEQALQRLVAMIAATPEFVYR
jgi:uncharacterized protein (DUF1800 family)